MTYSELLKITQHRKDCAIKEINSTIKKSFLAEAEIKRNPGMVAWLWLAKDFCETLAEHIDEFLEQTGDVDSLEAREIGSIYMAYEDDDENLYELLPIEARLFD